MPFARGARSLSFGLSFIFEILVSQSLKIKEMRRLVKSEIIVPLCFAELGEQTYQRLMTECAVTDVIGRHAIMMRDMHALHEWNEDLPLGEYIHMFSVPIIFRHKIPKAYWNFFFHRRPAET